MVAYWRIRSRSPGTVNPTASVSRSGTGQPHEDRADRLAVLLGRPGHPGHRQPDVGAEHPARPVGHGPGRLLGDDRALGHARGRRTSPRTRSDTTEPRNHALAPGTLTSRDAARPPVRDSASPRLSPSTASARATASSMASSSIPNTTSPATSARIARTAASWPSRAPRRPRLVGGPHGHPHLDPLDAAGQEGDGGRAARRVGAGRLVESVDVGGRAPRPGPTRSSPRSGSPGWRWSPTTRPARPSAAAGRGRWPARTCRTSRRARRGPRRRPCARPGRSGPVPSPWSGG